MLKIYEKLKQVFGQIQTQIGHSHCYLCRQASRTLVCDFCMQQAVLPLFPSPGHNLLEYPRVYKHLKPPAYERLFALGKYEGILAGLVNQLKFSKQPLAARVLSDFFIEYLGLRLSINASIPDALVPIPLGHLRYMGREYNQSRLLAQAIAAELGIECIDGLQRIKHTKQQSRLNKEDREDNIRHAFAVNQPINVESIALIDDVVTTGATINEACLCIQEAYPDLRISVWAMAVTMK